MIGAIRYVNSIGEEIAFGEGCWHYGKTDILDTSCAHRSIGGRITGFERNIREMSLTVELAGPEEERRRLADVTSYDVAHGPAGDAVGRRVLHALLDTRRGPLRLVPAGGQAHRRADRRERRPGVGALSLRDAGVAGRPGGGRSRLPPRLPHDYLYSAGAPVVMENPFRLPAKCDIYIPGPCSDPYVIIAGNRYQVLGDVDKGQLLIIKGYGDREIVVRHSDGTVRNVFDKRVTEDGARPFAEIPVGRSVASWSGSYNVEVVMYEERTSPW
ncbi:MAG: hypothetical protein ACLTDR_11770 [Adlercreutzia equolifaciens]